MDNPMIDRRIVRTEDAIENAFIEIVKEKGFEATRVSDIVTRSNINRSTFYLHYQDKFDLLEQLIVHTVNGLNEQVICAKKEYDQTSDDPKEGYKKLFLLLLEYMKKNRDLVLILLSLGNKNSLRERLFLLMQEDISNDLYPTPLNQNHPIPLPYWSAYVTNADIGVIEYWLKEGCKETTRQIADFMTIMFFAKTD